MRRREEINTVAVAGAGTIGTTVAQIFALYGYDVVVYEVDPANIQRSQERVRNHLQARVEQGADTPEQCKKTLESLHYTMEKDAFSKVDFVVECILEEMGAKKNFWTEISRLVGEEVVLTTNTSGLSISEISKAVHRPERFTGMHWMNPSYLCPLVEIIAGTDTATRAMDIVHEVCLSMKRRPVRVQDAPGFVMNRLQFALLREALHIVESGIASVEDVDHVMTAGLGMRYAAVGPFETADLGGLDTFYKISSYLFADLSCEKEVPKTLKELFDNGNYGVKTKKGFYDYPGDMGEKKIETRDQTMARMSRELYPDL